MLGCTHLSTDSDHPQQPPAAKALITYGTQQWQPSLDHARRSRLPLQHRRHFGIDACSRGSPAGTPTAELPGGRLLLLRSMWPSSKGSRAGGPTAALSDGRRSLPGCTYSHPRGSRAGGPTAAAVSGGRRLLPSCSYAQPRGSRAAGPTAALPGGRRALPSCMYTHSRGSHADAPIAALPGGRRGLLRCSYTLPGAAMLPRHLQGCQVAASCCWTADARHVAAALCEQTLHGWDVTMPCGLTYSEPSLPH